MKKYLLLTGLWAVLTFNSAHANGYYYENDGYYNESPRYERRTNYQQPRYRDVEYVRTESPRYRRVTNAEARRYQERQIYRDEEPMINRIRPYIGLDIAAQKMKFGDKDEYMKDDEDKFYKDSSKSISGVIGARINQNFGIEAYYQKSSEEEKTFDLGGGEKYKGTLSFASYGVDFIGHLPIQQEFELLAALGLGQYDFETEDKYTGIGYSDKESKDFDSLGVRLGIGAQYNITDHFALRGMVRYVKMTDDDYIKNLIEASLGVRYMF